MATAVTALAGVGNEDVLEADTVPVLRAMHPAGLGLEEGERLAPPLRELPELPDARGRRLLELLAPQAPVRRGLPATRLPVGC